MSLYLTIAGALFLLFGIANFQSNHYKEMGEALLRDTDNLDRERENYRYFLDRARRSENVQAHWESVAVVSVVLTLAFVIAGVVAGVR